jgi:nitrite reductase (NADH) large subunit
MSEHLVIIGNGMAGCRLAEEVLARDPHRYAITIFGAEPRVNYNRIMLSPVLAGEKRFEDIVINDTAWYEANGITLHAGRAVTAIEVAARLVSAEGGLSVPYDRLVLATGSDPVRLHLPGADLAGVVTFRDLDDVEAMVAAADAGGEAVVIGGGLLGLEAAYGLARRGMKASVVHLMDVLMERQLDSAAGFLLTEALAERGVTTLLSAQSEAIVGQDGRVSGLTLKDGRTLPCSLLVMAVGIRPNTELAKAAGLEVGRGVVVDDQMRASDPAVFAIGECAEHRGVAYGLVAPIWDMCRTLADVLTGEEAAAYQGSVLSTRLKVSGVDVFSAGQFAGGEGCEDVVFRDAGRGVYKRLVLKAGRLAGAVMFGDAADGNWYFDLMRSGADVSEMRETLVFGQAITEGLRGLDPSSAVAAMADTAEICGCNGVCKETITTAIAGGLSTLDGVRAVTKASASCGSCTPLVEQLLKLALGNGFKAPSGPQPICKCAEHGNGIVRKRIIEEQLKSMPAVMQALEWKTPDGCATCRPALNYYLVCAWPGEYADDKQSRFINERAHANIQKDGTYSVVPRMWGGVTTPAELRAIADVAEKFKVRTVKVTGGQRIDLLGVRKDDLPAVWADLNAAGLVSGHAYGKALRTVKTCVGSDWCRFGTQDSTGLGVRLEKFMWGAWSPAKVKLGVSGCPRNCAEATCKDIGVICVDSGYEIHLGGAAGLHIRGTEVLTRVSTEQEAVWAIAALMQLYREEAWYGERIYKWMDRAGLEAIRAAIEDPERRKALYDRFAYSQRFYRSDPWAERVAGRHAEEFAPLARSMELADA